MSKKSSNFAVEYGWKNEKAKKVRIEIMANEVLNNTNNLLKLYTQDTIQSRILTIRGQQVLMDADLAELYQVKTIALNQAVKRNEARFPERYRFQLTDEEKSQLITMCDRFRNLKHSPYLRDAFDTYNTQYPGETTNLHTFNDSHDRWLIIDDRVYHFGASIKDLGKRWFSVDVITEHTADELISKLK